MPPIGGTAWCCLWAALHSAAGSGGGMAPSIDGTIWPSDRAAQNGGGGRGRALSGPCGDARWRPSVSCSRSTALFPAGECGLCRFWMVPARRHGSDPGHRAWRRPENHKVHSQYCTPGLNACAACRPAARSRTRTRARTLFAHYAAAFGGGPQRRGGGGARSGIPDGMPQGTPGGVPAYRRPIGRRHFGAADRRRPNMGGRFLGTPMGVLGFPPLGGFWRRPGTVPPIGGTVWCRQLAARCTAAGQSAGGRGGGAWFRPGNRRAGGLSGRNGARLRPGTVYGAAWNGAANRRHGSWRHGTVPGNCPARGMVPPDWAARCTAAGNGAARSGGTVCGAALLGGTVCRRRIRRRTAEPPADRPAAGGGVACVGTLGRPGLLPSCGTAGAARPVWCRLDMVPPIGGAVHGGTVLPGGCGLACMVPAIAGVVPGGAVSGRRGSGDCAGPGEGHVKKQSVGLDGSGGRPGALLGAASGRTGPGGTVSGGRGAGVRGTGPGGTVSGGRGAGVRGTGPGGTVSGGRGAGVRGTGPGGTVSGGRGAGVRGTGPGGTVSGGRGAGVRGTGPGGTVSGGRGAGVRGTGPGGTVSGGRGAGVRGTGPGGTVSGGRGAGVRGTGPGGTVSGGRGAGVRGTGPGGTVSGGRGAGVRGTGPGRTGPGCEVWERKAGAEAGYPSKDAGKLKRDGAVRKQGAGAAKGDAGEMLQEGKLRS